MREPTCKRTTAVSVVLFVLTSLLLVGTLEMGFTRDESFYFRYARSYANWFARVEGSESAEETHKELGHEAVVDTWTGNFEHPPLMKSLFGAAWRHLGRKDRRFTFTTGKNEEGQTVLRVTGLVKGEGFERGAQVDVLAPRLQGQEIADPARVIAHGEITKRTDRHAYFVAAGIDGGDLKNRCGTIATSLSDAVLPMTPCQIREAGVWRPVGEATAMRLVSVFFTAITVVLIFLLGGETLGWLAGLYGALIFLFVPRHFFHGHLIAFDMPIVAATMATLYAYWRAQDDRRWALWTGIAWGIALLTKHNALFMPVPLVVYWVWTTRRHWLGTFQAKTWRVGLPPLPLALLVMPIVGLVMLFVFWPKLWYDPYRALAAYLQFHLDHDHYMQWYFGQPLEIPPFPLEFPFVLTVFTVPTVFLFLLVWGWGNWFWSFRKSGHTRDPRALSFLLINGLTPVILIALPFTPIFGGVKHWMTGMPCLLLLAGHGLAILTRHLLTVFPGRGARMAVVSAFLVCVFLHPVHASLRAAPFGTAFYNRLVSGGAAGAADKRLTRLYWGHSSRQALAWLNAHAPAKSKVFFQNTTSDAVRMYKREGLLRHDIRDHRHRNTADYALVEPQKAFQELDIKLRTVMSTLGPEAVVTFEGVPMLRIYRSDTKLKE